MKYRGIEIDCVLRGVTHRDGLILLKNKKVVPIRNKKEYGDELGPTWNISEKNHDHNYEKIVEKALTSTNKTLDFLLTPIKVKP